MADETGGYVVENATQPGPMSLDEVAARVSKQGPGAMSTAPAGPRGRGGAGAQLNSRAKFGGPPPVPPGGGRPGHSGPTRSTTRSSATKCSTPR